MKIEIFIALAAFCALTSGVFVPPRPGHQKHLLGGKECTWGPSYWCQNLTAAAGCHAVRHCIQTVWVHMELPPDTSSICQTCLDMVKQARDQLQSNETQELIKEVFEGTCALIHIKPVVKECDKIADEYIPELIDTLASEMNPQVVCSVAGLCNNKKLLEGTTEEKQVEPKTPDTCEGCHTVVGLMEKKFNAKSRDEVLQGFLRLCGHTGSLSDACSNIVVTYFTEIYNHIRNNFNPTDVCLMAGECSAQFHKHANVEITPISHIGYVPIEKPKDDLPCELCEQLVGHLRDLLVANTTEAEFKEVLKGLCKQTNSFKAECLSLVEDYYGVAYSFLVSELNASAVCIMGGLCPGSRQIEDGPIIPLLPVDSVQKALEITPAPKGKPVHVDLAKDTSSVKIFQSPEQMQLPIDILMAPHPQTLYSPGVCVFCEYFLHFIQEEITSPKTEDEIKAIIDRACNKLPSSVNGTCIEFVDMYEPALVAILAQEIDPSQVCPLIKACPSDDVKDVEIFMNQESDGSKCSLCIFAVTELEEKVKNKHTEEDIKNALSKLCSELPKNLVDECNDFVNTYTNELVEMLIADLTPQEVCVYLKLCSDKKPASDVPVVGGDTDTNLIVDDTINGQPIRTSSPVMEKPQCVLCEFLMKEIQDQLKDNKTEEDIKRAVHAACSIMPKTIRDECNQFVDQYGDMIIKLLIETTVPEEICHVMGLCAQPQLQVEIFDCAICEGVVYAMEKILANPVIDHSVEHVLKKACRALPAKSQAKCKIMIDKYGKTIYDLVIHLADKGLVCHELGLCATKVSRPRRDAPGSKPCTWGPSYWCKSEANANECGTLEHCQNKVWGGSRPKRETPVLGAERCTWGPGYWCASEANANECSAVKHCQEKVWNAARPKRQVQKVGEKKCTWGPGYWCASEANANECDAITHCQEKVWNAARPKREVQRVGEKKCTWGPGYWCASEANANECSAVQHCQEKVWGGSRPKRQLGAERCTWGPSYWCASVANANECNSVQHCQEKVWKGTTP